MIFDDKKERAAAIVTKILQLLVSENLSFRDMELILSEAKDILPSIAVISSVPEKLKWKSLRVPMMDSCPDLEKRGIH